MIWWILGAAYFVPAWWVSFRCLVRSALFYKDGTMRTIVTGWDLLIAITLATISAVVAPIALVMIINELVELASRRLGPSGKSEWAASIIRKVARL